ncbi:asparaginase [Donghicola sp. C2-DW-16]|uniref:Asparaginase n=1 Tax=Donghicola mangrovi TaxID=2729614 RepID=A0ABX2PBE4_9RHOB|nr:asparaginase [Donghicola mangrovi]NVO26147.1 asparaginase [Donghicola mangrovi]
MNNPVPLAELWRGDILESTHFGHAVICDGAGQIVQAWGDPDAIIYPRSSAKMIQALPLIESGAADAVGLGTEQLALACASHQGEHQHTDRVAAWLDAIGMGESDLRCGVQVPNDPAVRQELRETNACACQLHNNCSGKHTGFLTLNRHLGGHSEYVEADHPVQLACRDAFEGVTGMESPGYGIDGCSAPNFATSVHGLARAMGSFASAHTRSDTRSRAQARLTDAMIAHPNLIAGTGRACTELMGAMKGRAAIKTGAEAVFVAILPEQQLGIALKVIDGGTRGSECAIAALLVKLGLLEADHPAVLNRMNKVQKNWRGLETGILRPAADLL